MRAMLPKRLTSASAMVRLPLRIFKQAGFACAIVSHQADAIVGVDFQLFDIQDIAAGIFQKDVFSFDY